MPVNRLRNIDEIVNQDGTTVVIEDLANGTGGSGGSVSAEGLAISRTEDSQYIDYAFNEGSTSSTLSVDGYLTSASDSFHMGGYTGSYNESNTLRKLSFSSDSILNGWGNVSDAYFGMAAMAGEGFALVVGGANYVGTSWTMQNHATFIDLTAGTTAFNGRSDFPSLTNAVYILSAASDGSVGVAIGGSNGSLPQDKCERYDLVSKTSTDSSFATLTNPVLYPSSTSDGNDWYVFGGYAGSSNQYTSNVDKASFSTTANLSSYGTMTVGRCRAGIGSDGDAAYLAGGNTPSATTTPTGDVSKYSLSSFSESVGFGSTNIRNQAACSGDGTQMIYGGGDDYNSILTTASKISYADGSSALMSGTYNKGTTNTSSSGFSGTV